MNKGLQVGWLELHGSVLCMACGDGWKQTPLYNAPYQQENCAQCGDHLRAKALALQSQERSRESAIRHGELKVRTAEDMRAEAAHDRSVHFSRQRHRDWQ